MILLNEEMNILKQNLKIPENIYIVEYDNKDLKESLINWKILNDYEVNILNADLKSLKDILYSKYYWCAKFVVLYEKLYNKKDAGLEQQQYKILEAIDQKLKEPVDWKKIQEIEESLL